MTEPTFLELDQVLKIHRDQIARYGGTEGVRDMGLLQSALAMPQAGSGGQYFHADLCEMAAAHLFHIASNHPFVDGNKRVALAAALVFLRMNGLTLEAESTSAWEEMVLEVATGKLSKAAVADFFRKRASPAR